MLKWPPQCLCPVRAVRAVAAVLSDLFTPDLRVRVLHIQPVRDIPAHHRQKIPGRLPQHEPAVSTTDRSNRRKRTSRTHIPPEACTLTIARQPAIAGFASRAHKLNGARGGVSVGEARYVALDHVVVKLSGGHVLMADDALLHIKVRRLDLLEDQIAVRGPILRVGVVRLGRRVGRQSVEQQLGVGKQILVDLPHRAAPVHPEL
eukprot:COSAG04_NODE_701_length_11012_cov_18.320718_4_plen_204_part_00